MIHQGIDFLTDRAQEHLQQAQDQVEKTTQRALKVTQRVVELNCDLTQRTVNVSFSTTNEMRNRAFDQVERACEIAQKSTLSTLGFDLSSISYQDSLRQAREATQAWSDQVQGYAQSWIDQLSALMPMVDQTEAQAPETLEEVIAGEVSAAPTEENKFEETREAQVEVNQDECVSEEISVEMSEQVESDTADLEG
jgi:hypothetical protein